MGNERVEVSAMNFRHGTRGGRGKKEGAREKGRERRAARRKERVAVQFNRYLLLPSYWKKKSRQGMAAHLTNNVVVNQ